jgi:hemerythrin
LNKSIEELTTEMRIKDEEHQKIVDSLNLSLSESKNKVENLENEIDILNKLVQQLLSNSWIH